MKNLAPFQSARRDARARATLLLVRLVALAAFALLPACSVVHGTGELLGFACEWVEWKPMDPTAKSAARPAGAAPDEEVCYLAWSASGRLALASKGDDSDTISCDEREDSRPTEADPLVVRPGQIAWIFGTYSDDPEARVVITTCADLDASGMTPGEYVAAWRGTPAD